MYRNRLIPKIIKYAYTILSQWVEEERNYFAKSKIAQVNTKQKKTRFERTVITFINNFFQQMRSILKYTQLGHITCMPRPENHPLLTELFNEINLGNKLDFQLFLHQIKNSYAIE